MPLSISSRYHGLPVYKVKVNKEETLPAVAMRPFSPVPASLRMYKHLVTGTDDMEYLAWRFYGNSREWWRIAEANGMRFPLDITPGMTINIPIADDVGKVVRDRIF